MLHRAVYYKCPVTRRLVYQMGSDKTKDLECEYDPLDHVPFIFLPQNKSAIPVIRSKMARYKHMGKSHQGAAWRFGRALVAGLGVLAVFAVPVCAAEPPEKQAAVKLGASGLQVPRFVSLKSNRVNVRKGPSTEYAIAWVFSRAGLPVEVVAEFENWRQIRDSEGSEGWVFHALLSGRRTALVMSWVKAHETITLYDDPSASANIVARLEPSVLGSVRECDSNWCKFTVGAYTGWIEKERLWGVYRNEKVK